MDDVELSSALDFSTKTCSWGIMIKVAKARKMISKLNCLRQQVCVCHKEVHCSRSHAASLDFDFSIHPSKDAKSNPESGEHVVENQHCLV